MIKSSGVLSAAAVLSALTFSTPASSHVTLEVREAPAGTAYKAVFRVGHGCEGSPTIAIRIQIPEGVIAVKPMPKPGWELTTVIGDYAKPMKYFDETLTKGVQEISWTGGKLGDDRYDEFVFRGTLPNEAPGTMLWFPVVQQCEKGVHRWIEIPATGKKPDDYKEPAPGVKLLPKM